MSKRKSEGTLHDMDVHLRRWCDVSACTLQLAQDEDDDGRAIYAIGEADYGTCLVRYDCACFSPITWHLSGTV